MSPLLRSIIILVSFHSAGILFFSLKIFFHLFNRFIFQSIMASLVRFSIPGTSLFFISFRIFSTADVMIGCTSDVSGLVFFCEGCRSCSVELYSSAQKRGQIFSISFMSVCTSFSSFSFHTFFFGPPLYSYKFEVSFNTICAFLS